MLQHSHITWFPPDYNIAVFFYSRPQHSQGGWEASIRWKRGEGEGRREGEPLSSEHHASLLLLLLHPVKSKHQWSIPPDILGMINQSTTERTWNSQPQITPTDCFNLIILFSEEETLLLTAGCSSCWIENYWWQQLVGAEEPPVTPRGVFVSTYIYSLCRGGFPASYWISCQIWLPIKQFIPWKLPLNKPLTTNSHQYFL